MVPKVRPCIHAVWRFLWGRTTGLRFKSSRITFKSFAHLLTVVCCIFIILVCLASYYAPDPEIVIDLSHNYFQAEHAQKSGNFLVNTSKCKIPDVDIWDAGIRRLLKTPESFKCAENAINLTYVENSAVIINEEALKELDETFDDITCCYRTIERIEQSYESFDLNADNLFRLSEECISMGRKTKPKSGFIKVTCRAKGFFRSRFKKYTNFHMVAMFPNQASNIFRKINWWENCLSLSEDEACIRFREKGRPPNIMVLGWDSTSRGNFHRFMPKAIKVLENTIEAVEMVGYNKVGENTLPNFVPLMTSLSLTELEKECFQNNSVPFDACPFIWKEYSAHNYLTVHLEDDPEIAIFNYIKTGFIKPPVDIYSRPFMLAAYQESYTGCIGYQRPEDLILNYVVDLAELAESTGIPYIMTAWLTDLSHGNMNNLKLADVEMARTLERLSEKGLLENTVFLLMSDHGYRYLEVRMTTPGWFEDILPTLWIKLPPTLVKEQAGWLEALEYNSRMLTTPFDMHEIFRQILSLSWPSFAEEVTLGKGSIVKKSTSPGISPFQKLPERTCAEAGIPNAFCSCIPPVACNVNSSFIKMAANMVIKNINGFIPPECTPLKIGTVTACGMINKTSSGRDENSAKGETTIIDDGFNRGNADELVVVVALYTIPGNFLFEGLAHYNTSTNQFFDVSKVSRMNQKKHISSCLVVNDSWMELLCYCDPLSIIKTFVGRIIP